MAEATSSAVAGVPRPYRGVSAADRRHQRREQLIEAGLQLFGTRGIAAVGIVDVCAEAGLTKRYFYENFASIDALAEAVFEHVTGNLVGVVAPAIEVGAGRDPRPALTVYARALLSDSRVVRLLAVESQTGPLKKYRDGFPTRAVELWFAFAAADDALPPPQDMRLKAYGFIGAAQQIGMAWLDGHLPLTIDEVINQLVDMFYRISGIAPPAQPDEPH
ncbi:MAG TPA: TetR/AcrR family transcriptional regulator [Mycobacterium sp.]|uniref:TetR/AcrR family transcriptional regulator n=1 Tax=Mycobacterium sp. TaxID=1785 RepID=UPI002B9C0F24|nr:TetR/AcrR family transcriptional regulator [Mycobacterium sp.]HXO82185.1 TetR/AcrR family transcriptional regulator [Mycobacterium sp.]